MLLKAAFSPPATARDELRALVTEVSHALPALEPVGQDFRLPLTTFGNVTVPDAARLEAVLQEGFGGVDDPPTLRFERPALDASGEVRLAMEGDVEVLVDIARTLPFVAARLDLYVDRRRFWPGLAIGRLGEGVDLDLAAGRVERWHHWAGTDWTLDGITLLRRTGSGFVVHSEILFCEPAGVPLG